MRNIMAELIGLIRSPSGDHLGKTKSKQIKKPILWALGTKRSVAYFGHYKLKKRFCHVKDTRRPERKVGSLNKPSPFV